MDVIYRASKVTDLFWLDHADLIRLTYKFPTSSLILYQKAAEHNEMLAAVLASNNVVVNQRRNGPVQVKEIIILNGKVVENNSASVKGEFASHSVRSAMLSMGGRALKGAHAAVNSATNSAQLVQDAAQLTMDATIKAGATATAIVRSQSFDSGSREKKYETKEDKEEDKEGVMATLSTYRQTKTKGGADEEEKILNLVRTLSYDEDTKEMVETEISYSEIWGKRLVFPEAKNKMKWDLLIGILIIFR